MTNLKQNIYNFENITFFGCFYSTQFSILNIKILKFNIFYFYTWLTEKISSFLVRIFFHNRTSIILTDRMLLNQIYNLNISVKENVYWITN